MRHDMTSEAVAAHPIHHWWSARWAGRLWVETGEERTPSLAFHIPPPFLTSSVTSLQVDVKAAGRVTGSMQQVNQSVWFWSAAV